MIIALLFSVALAGDSPADVIPPPAPKPAVVVTVTAPKPSPPHGAPCTQTMPDGSTYCGTKDPQREVRLVDGEGYEHGAGEGWDSGPATTDAAYSAELDAMFCAAKPWSCETYLSVASDIKQSQAGDR